MPSNPWADAFACANEIKLSSIVITNNSFPGEFIEGDEGLCVRAWEGPALASRPFFPKDNETYAEIDYPPIISAQHIQYLIGVSGKVRNLHSFRSEFNIYAVSSKVVFSSFNGSMFRVLHDHFPNNVTALAVHDDGWCATGDAGANPKISIVDLTKVNETSEDIKSEFCIQDYHRNGICALHFLADDRLVSCGGDRNRTIVIYQLLYSQNRALQLITSRTTHFPIISFASGNDCGDKFYSLTKNNVFFWTNQCDKKLQRVKSSFGRFKSCKLSSIVFIPSTEEDGRELIVCGAENGNLYAWFLDTSQCAFRKQDVHSGPIHALVYNEENHILLSGGSDSFIHSWDIEVRFRGETISSKKKDSPAITITNIATFDLRSILLNHLSKYTPKLKTTRDFDDIIVESLDLESETTLNAQLLSERGREIMTFTLATNDENELYISSCKNIAAGHLTKEISVDTHPLKAEFCTVGGKGDLTLRVWNGISGKSKQVILLPEPGTSCCYSRSGSLIVIGTHGSLLLYGRQRKSTYDSNDVFESRYYELLPKSCITINRASNGWISSLTGSNSKVTCVQFSPNDAQIAFGTSTGLINIYDRDSRNKFKYRSMLKGHTGKILSLDWSVNGTFIQSCAGTSQLFFWLVGEAKRIVKAKTLKGTPWASQTCTYGWPTLRFWNASSSFVNSVAVSSPMGLIAVGYDNGQVSIQPHPASLTDTQLHEFDLILKESLDETSILPGVLALTFSEHDDSEPYLIVVHKDGSISNFVTY
eukprot:g557.t1